jgi:hypothetical protein
MPIPREDHAKGATHEGEHHSAKRERTRPASGDETRQLIFTLNAATGAIIRIEKVDPAGRRSDVPREETVALAGKDNLHEIEAALDEAFEAGISSVLQPTGDDESSEETEEEKELRRILLTRLIGPKVRRRLQHRLVQRLILSRTLEH